MTHTYTSVEPIYSLFDLKLELLDYLLNDYQNIIEHGNKIDENNNKVSWEKSLNDALLRLGEYIATRNLKFP